MLQDECTQFSGVVGAVTRNTLRWTSAVTGFTALFVLFGIGFSFGLVGAAAAGQVVAQMIVAVFLARFALNGYRGELGGTVFSSGGGPWTEVVPVALRYMALTAVWMLPLAFLGVFSEQAGMAVAGSMMSGGPPVGVPGLGRMLAVVALYTLLSTLTPPLFLVVSVSAASFGDVFSPAHWRMQFSGRRADLFMVYVVYTGAIAMTLVLAIPVLAALAAIKWQLAVPGAIVAGLFGFGIMIDLLGRLSGFFAYGTDEIEPSHELSRGASAAAPAAAPGGTADGATDAPPDVAAIAVANAPDPVTSGRPPLADASAHVQSAKRRFANDPDGAIGSLEELRATHAPHPQVLHALWAFLVQSKRADDALDVAREAIPVMIKQGSTGLAAQVLKVHWAQRESLTLERESLMGIAAAMARDDDLPFAANTFALVLKSDKRDARAIKGILGIADRLAGPCEKPADAIKLYEFLLRTAPESPLVEYMNDGLQRARQLQERAKAS